MAAAIEALIKAQAETATIVAVPAIAPAASHAIDPIFRRDRCIVPG
jgi:hypothetical protein